MAANDKSYSLKRFVRFITRQYGEIEEGGSHELLSKAMKVLQSFLAIPIVLLIRALRPLVIIRFGMIISSRIGHFAANTEMYLCEKDLGLYPSKTIDFFCYDSLNCNQQLRKMWDRILITHNFVCRLHRVNCLIPGSKVHKVELPSDSDDRGLMAKTSKHLSFTCDEKQLAKLFLNKHNISVGSPFICFNARDSGYLDTQFKRYSSGWRGHDYRDSTVQNYLLAAEELVKRDYIVFRMGVHVKEKLNNLNPRIIDYATNGERSDFLDIYLCAHCQFFICDTAGISNVSIIFRRPVAFVNYIPLGLAHNWSPDSLFIPKKLWLQEEKRFLTFNEILNSKIGTFLESEQYEKLGIEVIENTPEEITALAIEMDERLNGTWQTIEEDEELQQRFWKLFPKSELYVKYSSRIGAEFLRQNRELLK